MSRRPLDYLPLALSLAVVSVGLWSLISSLSA